jgi:AAA+ superfamily predicted ATPase
MQSLNNLNNLNPETQLTQSTYQALLSKFSTNNPLLDPIIHMALYTLITIILVNLQKILNLSNIYFYLNIVTRFFSFYYYKYFTTEPNFLEKKVIIESITDNKKLNTLYIAVSKYLSIKSNLDLLKESPLKFTCEEDIDDTQLDLLTHTPEINKKISENKYKSLKYKDHEIFYLLNTSLITIYSDVERKRENYTITLSTKINKSSLTDLLEDFCNFCISEYIKNKKSNVWAQKIFVNTSENKWVSSSSNNKRQIDTVILKNNLITEVKQELLSFTNSEEWYRDRGIPYTWGYLFYGDPGTGKTSMINGISNFTKRHIHYLMLNNVKSDNDLLDLLKDIKYKDSILVLEDIDCMTSIVETRENKVETRENKVETRENKVETRENKENKDNIIQTMQEAQVNLLTKLIETKDKQEKEKENKEKSSLTLSGLLNAIDGVFNNDGRIMIMTSNHPEQLDAALIRSGRVNRKICFDNCDKNQVLDIYYMMFNERIFLKDLTLNLDYGKYSSADITGLFLRYKNSPREALLNFDKIEKIIEKKIVNKNLTLEMLKKSKTKSGYSSSMNEDSSFTY